MHRTRQETTEAMQKFFKKMFLQLPQQEQEKYPQYLQELSQTVTTKQMQELTKTVTPLTKEGGNLHLQDPNQQD